MLGFVGRRDAVSFVEDALLANALAGDLPADGSIGARTAAQLLNRYGQIENFPPDILVSSKKASGPYRSIGSWNFRRRRPNIRVPSLSWSTRFDSAFAGQSNRR